MSFRFPVPLPVSANRSMRSEHFRVTFPRSLETNEVTALVSLLESTRTQVVRRTGGRGSLPQLEVVVNETTGDFTGRTGRPLRLRYSRTRKHGKVARRRPPARPIKRDWSGFRSLVSSDSERVDE